MTKKETCVAGILGDEKLDKLIDSNFNSWLYSEEEGGYLVSINRFDYIIIPANKKTKYEELKSAIELKKYMEIRKVDFISLDEDIIYIYEKDYSDSCTMYKNNLSENYD